MPMGYPFHWVYYRRPLEKRGQRPAGALPPQARQGGVNSPDDFGSAKNRMPDATIQGLELALKKSKVGVGRPAKCPLKRARKQAVQKACRERIRIDLRL